MTDKLYEEPAPAAKRSPIGKDASQEPTVLDKLRERINKKVERPIKLMDVPERPGVSLKISPNISQHKLRSWRKNSGEDSKNGMDATKFACYVVGNTTVGIIVDGVEAVDENGYELNFASSAILDMTNTTRPIPDAVIAFFGLEPHVEAAALAILDAAGYGDTVDTSDPTTES
jgi:hypothetical protein